MNNAVVAALLAVLVFVVLASVCAFPFFNCAKKEKFSMQEKTKSYADRKCSQSVAVTVQRSPSTEPENHCCEWSKVYQLSPGSISAYFKAGNKIGAKVRYKVNFNHKIIKKFTEVHSKNGEVIPPPGVVANSGSFSLIKL